jgi:hypothetical protein
MKKPIILSISLVILFGLIAVSLYDKSDEHFLPFIRFKSISPWSQSSTTHYLELMQQPDSTYFLQFRRSTSSERKLIPWFGETVNESRLSCGVDIVQDSFRIAYDHKYLRALGRSIVPLRQGKTRIGAEWLGIRDSRSLAIRLEDGVLVIDQ